MAVGDTIAGQIRLVRETQQGDVIVVAGPFSTTELDQANFENRLFLNATPGRDAPMSGANFNDAPNARFEPGERLLVQHKSEALEEAIDFDSAGTAEIKTQERDLNTGALKPRTLTVADTTLEANPTSSKTLWVTFFAFRVPDRTRIGVKGHLRIRARENA